MVKMIINSPLKRRRDEAVQCASSHHPFIRFQPVDSNRLTQLWWLCAFASCFKSYASYLKESLNSTEEQGAVISAIIIKWLDDTIKTICHSSRAFLIYDYNVQTHSYLFSIANTIADCQFNGQFVGVLFLRKI